MGITHCTHYTMDRERPELAICHIFGFEIRATATLLLTLRARARVITSHESRHRAIFLPSAMARKCLAKVLEK